MFPLKIYIKKKYAASYNSQSIHHELLQYTQQLNKLKVMRYPRNTIGYTHEHLQICQGWNTGQVTNRTRDRKGRKMTEVKVKTVGMKQVVMRREIKKATNKVKMNTGRMKQVTRRRKRKKI